MMKELEHVPKFKILNKIESTDSIQYAGSFDSPLRLKDGWSGYLINSEDKIICGSFHNVDEFNYTAIFKVDSINELNILIVGYKYAYLDGYWGERVEIVLDTSRHWVKKQFKSQDTIEYISGNSRIRGKVGQTPSFPFEGEGKIISGGWDHEHCSICWETISELTQPVGYVDQHSAWICESCYSNFIKIKSIAFVDDTAVSQIRGLK